jgi:hypothetical protein
MASENKQFGIWSILVQGFVLGSVAFGCAELSLSHAGLEAGDHDMMLAQRLGLIYTPAVGVWLGWLQHSRERCVAGGVIGLAIGIAYFVLCMTRDFLAIMVGFPALLGAGLAALVGSNRSHGVGAFFGRLGKGLLAGLVLGYTYMFLLNTILNMFVPPERLVWRYAYEMWKGGLPAMAVASSFFLVLLRWAVGLVRVRLEEP